MSGVVVINKPEGYTSFDVVAVVRKSTGIRKCGHCGTLDPNATGVLPVLVGNATKAQDIIPNHDKEYRAALKFGIATDTLDVWGNILHEEKTNITKQMLCGAASLFVGQIMQTPPMYSAVSKDGVRLYELARKGIEVERSARAITIYKLTVDSFDETTQSGVISVSCSKGTYIRQLICDIAEKLGTSAVMTELVRTKACGFSIDEAISLDDFVTLCKESKAEAHIRDVESLFVCYDELLISEAQTNRFSNGNPLDISRTRLKASNLADKTILRVKSPDGDFIGLGITDADSSMIKMYKHFNPKN